MPTRDDWNGCRYPHTHRGHYESWFQRANHPSEPRAFWIRYTIFSPAGHPQDAIGELWAMIFDDGKITARKLELPLHECRFAPVGLDVAIGDATLTNCALAGKIEDVGWELDFDSPSPPLLLLPKRLYRGGFPKAKSLVGSPLASYNGRITIGDTSIDVDGWIGSQNHNWGSKHTDRYAWGQVAGFDNDPDAFLECGTGRIKVAGMWTPWITLVGLRLGGETIAVNGLVRGALAKAHFDYFHWEFETSRGGLHLRGTIEAPRAAFVALRYYNPPGGNKTCLNSKIARCVLEVEREGRPLTRLVTENRAAFEILTDDTDHGLIPVV